MNSPTSPPTIPAKPRLSRLEQLLGDAALEQAMPLDQAQAYLCAALSGPQPIPEEQWLAEVLGATPDGLGEAGWEAADLLRLLAAELQSELASDEPLELLLHAKEGDETGASDYVSWCQGYLHGIDNGNEDWFAALGAEDGKEDNDEVAYLDEQLFTLFVLTGDAEAAAEAAGEEWFSGEELQRLQLESEEKLPQVVADIYRFWVAKRRVKTIRRSAAKVGRNDPCPCGSGRKFKKCCAPS